MMMDHLLLLALLAELYKQKINNNYEDQVPETVSVAILLRTGDPGNRLLIATHSYCPASPSETGLMLIELLVCGGVACWSIAVVIVMESLLESVTPSLTQLI